jgi:phosphohistidine phosphatase
MKTLLILRHAKSSRDDPKLADHDRPLNERGKKAAKEAGRFLRDEDLVPDLIVSSTALRARKTAQKAAKQCEYPRAIELDDQLYLASAPTHYKIVRKAESSSRRLLIVGHNPGISEFLNQLVSHGDEELPTAGLAVIQLPIKEWQELTARTRGKLVQSWKPRDSK